MGAKETRFKGDQSFAPIVPLTGSVILPKSFDGITTGTLVVKMTPTQALSPGSEVAFQQTRNDFDIVLAGTSSAPAGFPPTLNTVKYAGTIRLQIAPDISIIDFSIIRIVNGPSTTAYVKATSEKQSGSTLVKLTIPSWMTDSATIAIIMDIGHGLSVSCKFSNGPLIQGTNEISVMLNITMGQTSAITTTTGSNSASLLYTTHSLSRNAGLFHLPQLHPKKMISYHKSGGCNYIKISSSNNEIFILLRSITDYYGGGNLGQTVMTIEDTIPHKQVLCIDHIVKLNFGYQTSYSRVPNLTPVVIGSECFYVEKALAINNLYYPEEQDPYQTLGRLTLYAILRYFLGFLLYGFFNISILLRKNTEIFFDDLARSRYNGFLEAFADPKIAGFDKYFIITFPKTICCGKRDKSYSN